MQIKITKKEDGKIKPYPLIQIYETPYIDGEPNDWMCGFELDDKNECAFRLWHISDNGERKLKISWYPKQDYSWDDYFAWFGTRVLRIQVDGEIYFPNEEIETDEEDEEWTTTN